MKLDEEWRGADGLQRLLQNPAVLLLLLLLWLDAQVSGRLLGLGVLEQGVGLGTPNELDGLRKLRTDVDLRLSDRDGVLLGSSVKEGLGFSRVNELRGPRELRTE